MRGFFVILLVLFAFAMGYYYMTTYSTLLIIKEISPTTITTTTTITPSPTTSVIYLARIYPLGVEIYGGGEVVDGEIHYGIRLKTPPLGYKYFIFSNLSLSYFSEFVGPFAWACNYETTCDPWGRCEENYLCDWIEFYEYNSTHTYAFMTTPCQDSFLIPVRYYPWEEDKIKNAWLVVVVVEENATLDQIMSNLYIA